MFVGVNKCKREGKKSVCMYSCDVGCVSYDKYGSAAGSSSSTQEQPSQSYRVAACFWSGQDSHTL
jgi:hypothetical protein